MTSKDELIAFAQKAFVFTIIHVVKLHIEPTHICVQAGQFSFDCLWKNGSEEHIEGTFYYEEPSNISSAHSATVVLRVIALLENGRLRRQFPLQNFYIRNLDSESPVVVEAY